MEKRLILAIALSLLILLSWSVLISKFQPIENKEVKEKTADSPILIPKQTPISASQTEPASSSLITLTQKNFEIIFVEPQAAIKEVIFKSYQSYKFPLQSGFLLGDKNLVFKKESITEKEAIFVYQDQDNRIIKRYHFPNSNYNIELEIEVQNLSHVPLSINFPLTLGVLHFGGDQVQARFQDITVALPDKILHLNARKESIFEKVKFLGLRDRYFCAVIEPESNDWDGFVRRVNPQESEIGLKSREVSLKPGQQIRQKFHIYLGPQELKLIKGIRPAWSAVMYYGTFNFIAQILLQFLELLHSWVNNWGGVIVILSFSVYILLFPLTLKQMRSMKDMQALQPTIEKLRETYKGNPQRLNKEIMELYRQHKVNPFGGCLPLVLQIPIFFALYQVLMRSVALKGAKFLWIKDLSAPDRLFMLPISLPILGNEVNLLPILMSIGMFIQQKLSTVATQGSYSEQQKIMTIIFPIMFGFIFYHMPAGLVLYWFINSLLMLLYQFRISRIK